MQLDIKALYAESIKTKTGLYACNINMSGISWAAIRNQLLKLITSKFENSVNFAFPSGDDNDFEKSNITMLVLGKTEQEYAENEINSFLSILDPSTPFKSKNKGPAANSKNAYKVHILVSYLFSNATILVPPQTTTATFDKNHTVKYSKHGLKILEFLIFSGFESFKYNLQSQCFIFSNQENAFLFSLFLKTMSLPKEPSGNIFRSDQRQKQVKHLVYDFEKYIQGNTTTADVRTNWLKSWMNNKSWDFDL